MKPLPKMFFFSLCFAFSSMLFAQNEPVGQSEKAATVVQEVPAQFSTPLATMKTFLRAMNEQEVEVATSCLEVPLNEESKATSYAFYLKGVIDRVKQVDYFGIPNDSTSVENFVFHDLGEAGKIEIVRTTGGAWKFPATTLQAVETEWPKWEDLPVLATTSKSSHKPFTIWLREQFPQAWRETTFLLPNYQWACLFVLIFLGFLADMLTRLTLRNITHFFLQWFKIELDADTEGKPWKPVGLLVNALVWLAGTTLIGLPGWLLVILILAVKFYAVVAGIWTAFRLIDLLSKYLQKRASRTRTKFDDLLVPLISRTLKTFALCIGLAICADAFNLNPMSILGGLGIGGIAIAFAAKDTIANVFGAVTLLADRPFEIGDWIATNGVEGTVETVGIRSTRLRTFYNSEIILPNSALSTAVIDNYGRRRYRRLKMNLGLQYDTPVEKIDAFCEGVRELVRRHPYTRKDYYHVYLNGFSDSSIDVLLYCFHECPDWSIELRERHRMLLDILKLATELGVSFAFPTRTLHMFSEEHSADKPMKGSVPIEEYGQQLAANIAGKVYSSEDRPGNVEMVKPPYTIKE